MNISQIQLVQAKKNPAKSSVINTALFNAYGSFPIHEADIQRSFYFIFQLAFFSFFVFFFYSYFFLVEDDKNVYEYTKRGLGQVNKEPTLANSTTR